MEDSGGPLTKALCNASGFPRKQKKKNLNTVRVGLYPCVCVCERKTILAASPKPLPSPSLRCEATLAGSSGGNVYADHNTHKHSLRQTNALRAGPLVWTLARFSIAPHSTFTSHSHRSPSVCLASQAKPPADKSGRLDSHRGALGWRLRHLCDRQILAVEV